MLWKWLADLVMTLHFAFIVFVVIGGVLAFFWRRTAWVHIPVALWGAVVNLAGWTCPLTPLEQWLRRRAGQEGYDGGFVEHYLAPIIYPDAMSRDIALAVGVGALAWNATVYGLAFWLRRQRGRRDG